MVTMTADLREQKAALRRWLAGEARRHSRAERATASRQLCERLRRQTVWQQARAILLFAPMDGETNIWPLLKEALAEGKLVALPRFVPDLGEYEVRQVADLDRDLAPGHFGIREPSPAGPVFDAKRLDLALVPGIGFALDGWRLGRGKGYYDRLLAPVHGMKCGVAFDWQVVASVPVEPHDVRLNCILTPTRWRGVAGPGGI